MKIEIEGLDRFDKGLGAIAKQLPFTMMRTLNDLAFDSRTALNAELKHGLSVRDNTANAFVVDKATKKITHEATIRMKDDWHKVALLHHYKGGKAVPIMFEHTLIKSGHMNSNQSAIPIKKMGAAAYKTLKWELRSGLRGSTKKGITGRSKKFIVSHKNKSKRTAHLAPGIYERLKHKVKPIMIFTDEAQYRKRLDMNSIVEKIALRRAEKYFFKNLDHAMRTAR